MLKDKLVLTIVSKDFDDLELWYQFFIKRSWSNRFSSW